MPEVTDKYIRIPVAKKKKGDRIRTITISAKEGIKALYAGNRKKIVTYLFLRSKGWTMAKAKKWIKDHKRLGIVYTKGFVKKINKSAQSVKEGRLGLCVISSGTVDRDGDILEPSGADFSNFRKNPRLLWSHNSGGGEARPSIGRVENVEIRNGKIFFTPVFDLKDSFAAEIYRKYKDRFLDAFSVGFLPKEWDEIEAGYHFKTWEGLEFSAVNVPANPEALVVLRSQKFDVCKSWKDWKKNKPLVDDDDDDDDEWKESFEGVISKSIDLYKKGKYRIKKMAKLYKKFGRLAPNREHFELALSKVAKGKLIEVKKAEPDKKALLKQLIKIADKLGNE